ncbi:hypothetical protein [Legionella sp. PC997]|uniref:hypothetical protein n=1 Tax=Legionella sp. PC997 TaxID=2755562 RepID=UPI0015FCE5FF|nr:hypothetical protein [Legionella sp. PC997]QMT59717.1 hypothetical protein HBNCFIEN_01084 [Legionella sp. PC997]
MEFRDKLYSLFKFHLCLSNGVCDRDGHYVPIDDAISGDFDSNRKHFREGELGRNCLPNSKIQTSVCSILEPTA